MTLADSAMLRLQFLTRVVGKESRHLEATDQRLFTLMGLDLERVRRLEGDPDASERVEAFVGRFCRLQDTLGDKLLPELLRALGEKLGPVIDNLDRAERLGWVESADQWLVMRSLWNQMVHEYVEDPLVLHDALHAAHAFVPVLVLAAARMTGEIERRGWRRYCHSGQAP